MKSFQGLPPGLFEFFAELESDNTKEFWQAHKPQWEREVREPMGSLLAELSDEFGPLRMFRPNRDVRFSKDKSPYKLWTGATSEARAVGGIGYYLEVSARNMVTGYGAMLMARDQLQRFRAAIDDESSGAEFGHLTESLSIQGLPVTHGVEQPIKTAPRGYSSDHPRIHYLRWKGAAIVLEWETAEWMHTREALSAIGEVWNNAAPLKSWLGTHVGAC